ncbi:hypothetical protein [Lysobacter gummosus]|uniref:Uncharacterized protein n=1 Tax=Lysobacter gummosus TaxID=262324 RepID=A0ABY3XBH6_9GAMM|nr:hypothetical protein [Lysobacter gummosus]UNP28107.1 hypothetical protein MOV92_16585 [Lysobacter gummosus]
MDLKRRGPLSLSHTPRVLHRGGLAVFAHPVFLSRIIPTPQLADTRRTVAAILTPCLAQCAAICASLPGLAAPTFEKVDAVLARGLIACSRLAALFAVLRTQTPLFPFGCAQQVIANQPTRVTALIRQTPINRD